MNKKILLLLTLIITLISLTSCVTKNDLKEPVGKYLSKNYGIKDDFTILSTDDNWFEGIAHQTYIKINKPYDTTAYLVIERDSFAIDESSSDDLFMELFKGAYVKQHPEVLRELKEVINKHHLMSKSPNDYDEGKENFYYYIRANIDKQQRNELVKDFKKKQTIDTTKLLKELKVTNKMTAGDKYRGIINFIFYYNTYKNDKEVPQAQSILQDLEKSHVLTEGTYSIGVQTIHATADSISQGVDPQNSHIRFKVDSTGAFHDIEVKEKESF